MMILNNLRLMFIIPTAMVTVVQSLSLDCKEKEVFSKNSKVDEMKKLLNSLTEEEIGNLSEQMNVKLSSKHGESENKNVPNPEEGRHVKRSPPGGHQHASGGSNKHSHTIRKHRRSTSSMEEKSSAEGDTGYKKNVQDDITNMMIKRSKQKRSARKKPSYYAPDYSTSEDNAVHHRSKRSFLINWTVLKEVLGWDKRSKSGQPQLVYMTARVKGKQKT